MRVSLNKRDASAMHALCVFRSVQTVKTLQQLTSDAAEEAAAGGGDTSVAAVERAAAEMLADDPDLAALVRSIE